MFSLIAACAVQGVTARVLGIRPIQVLGSHGSIFPAKRRTFLTGVRLLCRIPLCRVTGQDARPFCVKSLPRKNSIELLYGILV